jgi:hypothetical protein
VTVFARRRRVRLGDENISVISPEDLIIAKLIGASDSRSEMQFRDIGRLLERTDLDMSYIEQTAMRVGVTGLLGELRARHD